MSLLKFQTVERDSIFTHLDLRPKLVMVSVISLVAFTWESPRLQAILAAALVVVCLAAGVKTRYLRLIFTFMLPFDLFILLSHGFFNVEQVLALTGKAALTPLFRFPPDWWLIGGGMLSLEGLLYGLNVALKTLSLTLVIPLAIFTSDIDNLVVSLVQARVPYKIAFIFSATLRFFPLLLQEAQNLIEAQRLRGLAVEELHLLPRARLYAQIAIPLILSALVRSQQVEVVLQSKAFSGSPDRTYLHESVLHTADYALMGFFALFLLAAAVLYFTWGIGRFGGPF